MAARREGQTGSDERDKRTQQYRISNALDVRKSYAPKEERARLSVRSKRA